MTELTEEAGDPYFDNIISPFIQDPPSLLSPTPALLLSTKSCLISSAYHSWCPLIRTFDKRSIQTPFLLLILGLSAFQQQLSSHGVGTWMWMCSWMATVANNHQMLGCPPIILFSLILPSSRALSLSALTGLTASDRGSAAK